MTKVFIIAEAACTWLHGGLEAAYRSIQAAKACGADAFKTQWTSDPEAMAMRRGVARDKYTRLGWGVDALPLLKAECDRVGIEFMCTVFIPKDACTIHPYLKRAKVAAFERNDRELINALRAHIKDIIISYNGDAPHQYGSNGWSALYCVSEYPTPLESLKMGRFLDDQDEYGRRYDGLSDHTTSVLTGAVAVGAGARIIEKHVRLSDTPETDPDYGHSLICEWDTRFQYLSIAPQQGTPFKQYVDNIREAERML